MKINIQNKILIIVALVISFVATFMFSSQRLPICDDICYLFIFDDNAIIKNQSLFRQVQDFSDIVESQTWHYLHVNGRAPVHYLVQIFDNLLGYNWFGIFNSLFYIAFIAFIVKLIQPKNCLDNPLLWVIVCLCVQYMFPYGFGCNIGPWYSIAMGINYLWTGTLFILFLLLWGAYNGMRSSWHKCVLFCLLGLFTGWSNEAFALPLSAGLFIYYILYKKRFKTNSEICLVLTLWLGTCLLVFAPGTFNRIGHQSEISITNLLLTCFECYAKIKLIWILLIILIIYRIKNKNKFNIFIRANSLLCIIFIVAFIMSIFAHTMPHSLLCIEIISMILIIKILNKNIKLKHNICYNVVILTIILVYATHIYYVIKANINQYEIHKQMIIDFKNSPDGVVKVNYPKYNGLINSFIDVLDMRLNKTCVYSLQLAALNGEKIKPITNLSEEDYTAIIDNSDNTFKQNTPIPGSANLYDTGSKLYYYAPLDSLQNQPNKYKVVASFEGDSFTKTLPLSRRIVYRLIGNRKPPKELDSFILKTRKGYYLVAEKILSTPSRIDIVAEDS